MDVDSAAAAARDAKSEVRGPAAGEECLGSDAGEGDRKRREAT